VRHTVAQRHGSGTAAAPYDATEEPMTQRRVHIIHHDPTACEVLRTELERRDFEVITHGSADEALRNLPEEDIGVVVAAIDARTSDGNPLYRRVMVDRLDTPVIVTTHADGVERAIAAIREGAYDFLTTPFEADAVALTLERALKHCDLLVELKRLRRPPISLDSEDPARMLSMEEVEHRYVTHVLEAVRGNKALAARVLGMDRRTLYRKLDRWREGDRIAAEA
jgi:DNA-binding NtrC family response regulator